MKESNGMGWLACRHESHGARDIVKKKEEVNCDREKGERESLKAPLHLTSIQGQSRVLFDQRSLLYPIETLETVFKLN